MNTLPLHMLAGRPAILVAEDDARRLSDLLRGGNGPARDAAHLRELRAELERAVIVTPQEIPADVITLYRAARVLDLGDRTRHEFTLVYPHDADPAKGRISVLAPLGTALLGYREGDEVEWLMPGGLRRLRIESVREDHETAVRH
jgi:regulator of nucleoside diphosphate kinase